MAPAPSYAKAVASPPAKADVMKLVCAWCNKTFLSECEEAEARAELERDFPGAALEDCELVCHSCYLAMSLALADPAGCA